MLVAENFIRVPSVAALWKCTLHPSIYRVQIGGTYLSCQVTVTVKHTSCCTSPPTSRQHNLQHTSVYRWGKKMCVCSRKAFLIHKKNHLKIYIYILKIMFLRWPLQLCHSSVKTRCSVWKEQGSFDLRGCRNSFVNSALVSVRSLNILYKALETGVKKINTFNRLQRGTWKPVVCGEYRYHWPANGRLPLELQKWRDTSAGRPFPSSLLDARCILSTRT